MNSTSGHQLPAAMHLTTGGASAGLSDNQLVSNQGLAAISSHPIQENNPPNNESSKNDGQINNIEVDNSALPSVEK